MPISWLLDTGIIIDFLRGMIKSASEFIEKITAKTTCHIYTLTIAELYAGVRETAKEP